MYILHINDSADLDIHGYSVADSVDMAIQELTKKIDL